ncbi:MAG: UDP-N-acetylmuramate--L-alanine ligase [Alphaproteobacteria bacterium]|nr:UDP-N-acetylmuramate--L-alanine ligase [Alphaproteobacteria bacterium]
MTTQNHLPFPIGTIHFIGIGGSGMSCIAELMHNLGYSVQGSDISENSNVKRLRSQGISIIIGHAPENVEHAGVVVVSSAIDTENVEIKEARMRRIPVVRRAEMLAELMRLKWSIAVGGTHGKTTTTSMIGLVLQTAGLDPTVANGGIINAYGTNAHLGDGQWLVAEADESDGSFLKLPATAVIVTNMDPEHLNYYGTYEKMKDAYRTFVQNIPFYGFACLCVDHPEVQRLISQISDRQIITYGFTPQAEVTAQNIHAVPGLITFDVVIADSLSPTGKTQRMNGFSLPVYGRHNVLNALAAIGVGIRLGISEENLKKALSAFTGVQRRFTKTGEMDGITIIDDYGHHPIEIASTLKAARDVAPKKVIAVFQPHRYTRVADLFEMFCTAFNDADCVIVADVYSAGEEEIPSANKEALAEGLRSHGHRHVITLNKREDLAGIIRREASSGDIVICLGAGSISSWAKALPQELAQAGRVSNEG